MGTIKLKSTELEEAKKELLSNYSMDQILESLAGYILDDKKKSINVPSRISITKEQFEQFFKIKGEDETRGRKKTIITDEDKEAQRQRVLQYQRDRYNQKKKEAENK